MGSFVMIKPIVCNLLGKLSNFRFKLRSMSACNETLYEQHKDKKYEHKIYRRLKAEQI